MKGWGGGGLEEDLERVGGVLGRGSVGLNLKAYLDLVLCK